MVPKPIHAVKTYPDAKKSPHGAFRCEETRPQSGS